MCLTQGGRCPHSTSTMGDIRGALPQRSLHRTLSWYTLSPYGWGIPPAATQDLP
jgi:hypothetical protein